MSLAQIARRFALVELALLLSVATGLVLLRQWSATEALTLSIAIFFGWRLLVAITSFVLARRASPGRGSRHWVVARLVLAEFVFIVVAYSLLFVVPRWFVPAPSAQAATSSARGSTRGSTRGRHGVLLVHGYICSAAIWWWFARQLRAAGYVVDTVTLEPVFGSIEDQLAALAQQVVALQAQTGGRISILGHSMGGLASRAYMRAYGADKIDRLITCGTPHFGTVHARWGPGLDARQMRRDGAWLATLAEDVPELAQLPGGVTTIASVDDNLIAPVESAILPGARSVMLAGVSHCTMPFSSKVLAAVLAALPVAATRSEMNPAHQIG